MKTYNCFSFPSLFLSLVLTFYSAAAVASNTFEYKLMCDGHGNDTLRWPIRKTKNFEIDVILYVSHSQPEN